MNLLESKDVDYSVKIHKQRKTQIADLFYRPNQNKLSSAVAESNLDQKNKNIFEDAPEKVLKTLDWKVGDKFSAAMDVANVKAEKSNGSIIFIAIDTEIATVQYDDPECPIGFMPTEYDLQQNIMLDPNKKIHFVELHKLIK